MAGKKTKAKKQIETLTHPGEKRKNIPTAEFQSVMEQQQQDTQTVRYPRNTDLDPQIVWRGKDQQDWSDLIVHAPPLYIQEKVHPKVLIDDLRRVASDQCPVAGENQLDLFGDFNGLPSEDAKTEFYQHDQNWSNRMILGDSLQVMASLAEREGLRGKVQCIYFDPPYGIKFNSNFQWSTTSRDVKDGKVDHITREPEQVKAFRDTWRDGIHSYLTYLRDRLTVARDLLTDSGSIFVQIGDENVHRVRALMDEVFGESNLVAFISVAKTSSASSEHLAGVADYILFYAKDIERVKYRQLLREKAADGDGGDAYRFIETNDFRRMTVQEAEEANEDIYRHFRLSDLRSNRPPGSFPVTFEGRTFSPTKGFWKTGEDGFRLLTRASRLQSSAKTLNYVRYVEDYPAFALHNIWIDLSSSVGGEKVYVVQTGVGIIQRCILMASDPGDLVLDPTCGSGTTAYVSEQWGRRWITIDTSRVALALARARIMGARYPFYLLADSPEGQQKEGDVTRTFPSTQPTYGNIRHGFVYERVPHITLKSIANNSEIDVIWDEYQLKLEPLREQLNKALGTSWEEWEIPRDLKVAHASRLCSVPESKRDACTTLLEQWWDLRIARQKEIDKSIAAKAEYEFLYDKPYSDNKKVRVAGPFTVESLSPHRVLSVDEDDELLDTVAEAAEAYGQDFTSMILDNLRTSGVQQAHKEDRIQFISMTGWPGHYICSVGTYTEGNKENGATKRAGIFIGPEFGTVSRPDLVAAAREAGDANFDVLIACAFNFEARTTEFSNLGRIPVLKARMNADLHMAGDLKNTGKGNLFVVFGEPDITVTGGQWLVTRNGREIENYECIKELSGLGSLDEINRAGRKGLSSLCNVSAGRAVRDHQSNSEGGHLGGGEHRRGSGTGRDEGVSSLSEHSGGIAGGDGNLSHTGGAAGTGHPGSGQSAAGAGGSGWTDDQRAKAVAAVKALTDADFPLELTTGHRLQITVNGVDVFHPNTGEVRSDGPEGIACWFIDTDYNEESFFVRHAYFLGQNDPYKALKTTLKAEINQEAWETLNSAVSRSFDKPKGGRIAVKVINHLGDEVMKVFRVQ